jgi:hypothetical protein
MASPTAPLSSCAWPSSVHTAGSSTCRPPGGRLAHLQSALPAAPQSHGYMRGRLPMAYNPDGALLAPCAPRTPRPAQPGAAKPEEPQRRRWIARPAPFTPRVLFGRERCGPLCGRRAGWRRAGWRRAGWRWAGALKRVLQHRVRVGRTHLERILQRAVQVLLVVQQHTDGLRLEPELAVDLKRLLKHLVAHRDLAHRRPVKVVQPVDVVLDARLVRLRAPRRPPSPRLRWPARAGTCMPKPSTGCLRARCMWPALAPHRRRPASGVFGLPEERSAHPPITSRA